MYEVLLYPDAQAAYTSADKALAKKIGKCLQQLEQTPLFHPNIKALKGNYAGYYRYRIGDCRVIYSVDDEVVKVFVLTIVKRGEAYESSAIIPIPPTAIPSNSIARCVLTLGSLADSIHFSASISV